MPDDTETLHDLTRSPSGTVHAVHDTLRYRTVCGAMIEDTWEDEERDYHPSFCSNCKDQLTRITN